MDKYEEFQLKEELKRWKRKAENNLDALISVRDKEEKSIKKRAGIAYEMMHCAEMIGRLKCKLESEVEENEM